MEWIVSVTNAILHPPSWWNRSENISGVVQIVLFAVITYVVVSLRFADSACSFLATCWARFPVPG